jgi:hypothetical protein
MKKFLCALILSSSLASVASAETASAHAVFFKVYDFYSGKKTATDAVVTAKNVQTGEEFTQEREISQSLYDSELGAISRESNGVIFLAPGTYTFAGQSNFCFISEQTVEIKADTQVVDLKVGCE